MLGKVRHQHVMSKEDGYTDGRVFIVGLIGENENAWVVIIAGTHDSYHWVVKMQ